MVSAYEHPLSAILLEPFLLARAEAKVRGRAPERQGLIGKYFEAAELRLLAARDLRDQAHPAAVLVLYREATAFLIGAVAASVGENEVTALGDPRAAWKAVDEMLAHKLLGEPPRSYETARATLSETDPFAFDHLSSPDATARLAAVETTVDWLREAVEPRTLDQLKRVRIVRLGALGIATIGAVVALAMHLFTTPNLALHKTATSSSLWPGSGSAAGVTNGVIEATYGAATNKEHSPWITVDLGGPHTLSRVRVFPRGDMNFEEMMPAVLELSEDGVHFAEIERRTVLFTQSDPWVIKLKSQKARYVRVRADRDTVLALTEIEVQGH